MTIKDDINNDPKLVVFLFIGVGVGFIFSGLQSAIHYMTNANADVSFLGLAFINSGIGVVIIGIFMILNSKIESDKRQELLKIPEKATK